MLSSAMVQILNFDLSYSPIFRSQTKKNKTKWIFERLSLKNEISKTLIENRPADCPDGLNSVKKYLVLWNLMRKIIFMTYVKNNFFKALGFPKCNCFWGYFEKEMVTKLKTIFATICVVPKRFYKTYSITKRVTQCS